MLHRTVETFFGSVTLSAHDGAITRLAWGRAPARDASRLLDCAAAQMREYAAGQRTDFDLPLRVTGGTLVQAVCAAMLDIPFGQTRTYGDIAKTVGASAQAVGQACGRNPIPIIVPCHRVMEVKGLSGYSGAGGVETKLALLKHEGAGGFLI